MQQSTGTAVFRISDLTAKRIEAPRGGLGVGSVGYLGPDQDPDDFTPISPWVMLGKVINQVDYLHKVDVAKLDIEVLDQVALNVGRSVVAGGLYSVVAHCLQDMPTCEANQIISNLAKLAESITNIDLGVVRHQMEQTIDLMDGLDKRSG